MCEPTDARLCLDGAGAVLGGLSLAPEHRPRACLPDGLIGPPGGERVCGARWPGCRCPASTAASCSRWMPVAAPEAGSTSWTAVSDAVRLGPVDEETAVTAAQLGDVWTDYARPGNGTTGSPDIRIVMDGGYDRVEPIPSSAHSPRRLVGPRGRSGRRPPSRSVARGVRSRGLEPGWGRAGPICRRSARVWSIRSSSR